MRNGCLCGEVMSEEQKGEERRVGGSGGEGVLLKHHLAIPFLEF